VSASSEPIGVIGTGYVGLVTAVGFASLGSDVWCVDIDAEKVALLRNGEVPIYEPGLKELLDQHRERLRFSTEIGDAVEHARLLFVAVGTPPTHSGDADLTAVHEVVDSLLAFGSELRAGSAEAADGRRAIVMKSTVPCGTGASIKRRLDGEGQGWIDYVSCPEFLKEGSAVADFLSPDRVVVGDDRSWAGEAVVELYAPLEAPLVRTDVASAEMIKLAANAFLATKISFINEIANVCEQLGADVVEVAQGMGLDARIGPKFLQAGIGYGGSCFTKDVSALKLLAGNSGYHFQLLNAVIEVNELQKRRVVGKLARHLGALDGRRIALLGLAFKPETDDMRGASSLVLASRLLAEGADVRAYDPIAEEEARKLMPQLSYCSSSAEALEGCDAAVLVTEWAELVSLDWNSVAAAMSGTLLIDGADLRGRRPLMSAASAGVGDCGDACRR
jgi:UDPglucose 6-dehydrogenase